MSSVSQGWRFWASLSLPVSFPRQSQLASRRFENPASCNSLNLLEAHFERLCTGVYLVMNQVHQAHLLLAEGKQVLELHQYPLQLQLLLVAQPPHCSASRSPSSQTAGLLFPLFSGRSAGCSTLQLGVDTGQVFMSGVHIFPFIPTPSRVPGLVGHPQ